MSGSLSQAPPNYFEASYGLRSNSLVLLGGSWVVISGIINKGNQSHNTDIRGLITLLTYL